MSVNKIHIQSEAEGLVELALAEDLTNHKNKTNPHNTDWESIKLKPPTFNPATHTHKMVDLPEAQIKNTVSDIPPASPVLGETWLDTTTGLVGNWDGSQWTSESLVEDDMPGYPLIIVWEIPTDNFLAKIPLSEGDEQPEGSEDLIFDCVVDWGDGTITQILSNDNLEEEHVYVLAGTYTVSITGICEGIDQNNNHSASWDNITDILSWGRLGLKTCHGMFSSLDNIISDISANDGGNFSEVTDMDSMFNSAWQFTSLNVEGWNIEKVEDLAYFLYYCKNVTVIHGFNDLQPKSLVKAHYAFSELLNLVGDYDLRNWDMSKLVDGSLMFSMFGYYANPGEISLDISTWNTSNLENTSGMFELIGGVTELNLANWNVGNVINMSSMFNSSTHALTIDLTGWETQLKKVTTIRRIFANTEKDTTIIGLENWDLLACTNLSSAFSGGELEVIDLSTWNTPAANNVDGFVNLCSSLTTLITPNLVTSGVTNVNTFARNCPNLINIDVTNWDISSITSASDFCTQSKLTTDSYDALLINFAGQSVNSNVYWNFGTSQYTKSSHADTARVTLVTAGWNITDGGPIGVLFKAASYNPDTFELQQESIGVGGHFCIHTADIYSPDYLGKYHVFGENDPVFEGYRKVENLLTNSNNPNGSNWQFSGPLIESPDNPGWLRHSKPAGGANAQITAEIANIQSTQLIFSAYLGARSTSNRMGLLIYNVTQTETINTIDIMDTQLTANPNARWAISTIGQEHNLALGDTLRFYVYSSKYSNEGDWGEFKELQVEDVAQNTIVAPSNYIDTLLVPIAKYFANSNGNSVLDNVVTEAVGSLLNPLPWLKYQEAAQNEIEESVNLSLWGVLAELPIIIQDATHLDGKPNTAYSLEDASVTKVSGIIDIVTIPSTTGTVVIKGWVTKDSDETAFPEYYIYVTGGTANRYYVQFNKNTGEIKGRTIDHPDTRSVVIDNGDTWIFLHELYIENVTAVNVGLRPAVGKGLGTYDATTIGRCEFVQTEAHINTTIEKVKDLGPIFTDGTPAATDETIYNWAEANHDDKGDAYEGDFKLSGKDQVLLSMGSDPVLKVEQGISDDLIITDWHDPANWTISGSNMIEYDVVEDAIKITYVDNIMSGYFYLNAGANVADPTEIGASYILKADVKRNAVGPVIYRTRMGAFGSAFTATEDWNTREDAIESTVTSGGHIYAYNMAAGEVVWLRNLSFKKELDTKQITLSDGTNECSVPVVSPEPLIKASYGDAGMTLDVDGVTDSCPYDGSLGTGDLGIEATVSNLRRIKLESI